MKHCDRCHEKQATVRYRESIGGATRTLALCRDCAEEMGILSAQEDLFAPFSMFSFAPHAAKEEADACPVCHRSLDEIRKTGRFGCSACYDRFADRLDLAPFIGKGYKGVATAASAGETAPKKESGEESLDSLKRQLKSALAVEDYESAAKLRDRIREKEAK